MKQYNLIEVWGVRIYPQPMETLDILLKGKRITQTLTNFTSREKMLCPPPPLADKRRARRI